MTNPANHQQLIEKILGDPLLLRRLTQRVYQLLLDEVYYGRDRNPGA